MVTHRAVLKEGRLRMLHLLLMEDHADLLRAIAVTWSPHERPDPRILALPAPSEEMRRVLAGLWWRGTCTLWLDNTL